MLRISVTGLFTLLICTLSKAEGLGQMADLDFVQLLVIPLQSAF